MVIASKGWVSTEEIANRIDQLQTRYAENPLVKKIDYQIGVDWSNDPAVFINITVARSEMPPVALNQLAERIRADLLEFVRTDEIGLHSYLSFVN